MFFRLYAVYNKYDMIKIDNQTREKLQVLLQFLVCVLQVLEWFCCWLRWSAIVGQHIHSHVYWWLFSIFVKLILDLYIKKSLIGKTEVFNDWILNKNRNSYKLTSYL